MGRHSRTFFLVLPICCCFLLWNKSVWFGNNFSAKLMDYKQPCILRTEEHETSRLNQLLAHPFYECLHEISFSSSDGTYIFCNDTFEKDLTLEQPFLSFVAILIDCCDITFEKQLFESVASPKQLTVICPHGASPCTPSPADSSVLLLKPADIFHNNSTASMVGLKFSTLISGHSKHINCLRIDLGAMGPFDSDALFKFEVLNFLLSTKNPQFPSVDQLILTVNLPKRHPVKALHAFYLSVHQMFFDAHLAVFTASHLRPCRHCSFRIGLINGQVTGDAEVLAPIAGAGSPEEEFQRLKLLFAKMHKNLQVPGPQCFVVQFSGFTNYTPTAALGCFQILTCNFSVKMFDRSNFSQTFLKHCKLPVQSHGFSLIVDSAGMDEVALRIFDHFLLNFGFKSISYVLYLWYGQENFVYRRIFSKFQKLTDDVDFTAHISQLETFNSLRYEITWLRKNSEVVEL